ncbi:MAG: thioredoxin [Gemmatimonadaceae bacterium]
MPAETGTAAPPATDRKVTVRCQFCLTWNRLDATRIADKPKCGKCAKPILLDRPLKLDSETFARTVAESQIPVFVDFYADWCGPCKMMAPAVDALAAKYTGKAIVAKLDTDRAPAISQQFGIRGIPTSIVFSGGKEAARASGALPLAQLEGMLTAAVSH